MKQTEMQGKKVYNIKFSGRDTYPKKKKVSEKQKQYVCPINTLRHKLWSNYCLVSQINNNNNYKNVVTRLPH